MFRPAAWVAPVEYSGSHKSSTYPKQLALPLGISRCPYTVTAGPGEENNMASRHFEMPIHGNCRPRRREIHTNPRLFRPAAWVAPFEYSGSHKSSTYPKESALPVGISRCPYTVTAGPGEEKYIPILACSAPQRGSHPLNTPGPTKVVPIQRNRHCP